MESHLYSPFWTRLLAHNIDLVLFLPVGYGLSEFIELDFTLYSCIAVIYILYNTIMEITPWNGSLGKRLLSIKVSPLQGADMSLWRSLLRNCLKFISLGLLFSGFLMIRFNMKRQGLHDWLSGSAVILS